MRERPIIFNAEMVRAILEGKKTQTRRVIKPQPPEEFKHFLGRGIMGLWTMYPKDDDQPIWERYCLYGKPGDQLWVRETFCVVDDREFGGEKWIDYRATPKYSAEHPAGWENDPGDPDALKWKPSIFMPRKASRIQLEVVEVRVEKVQDITTNDAKAEGVGVVYSNCLEKYNSWDPSRILFSNLWDSINKKRGFNWEKNPWVWVVHFKVIEVKNDYKN